MRTAIVTLVSALCLAMAGTAHAKLPAPTPEQQAKAAEAKAKAAETGKKAAEQLAKAQDRAADNYRKGKGKADGAAQKK